MAQIILAVWVLIAFSGFSTASASVFASVYTGEARFDTGADRVGLANNKTYDFTSTFTYDTTDGVVDQLGNGKTGQRYDGPVRVVTTIAGVAFSLDGSSASSVERFEGAPTSLTPSGSSFADDDVFAGISAFTGDYIINSVSFAYVAFPPSVAIPFVADVSGLGIDNIGSFSLQGGQVTGQFLSDTLVVSAVPLPASAPMFGCALLALAGFRHGVNRWALLNGKQGVATA